MADIKTIDIDEAAEMLDDEMQEMLHNGWDDSEVVYANSMAEIARQLGVTTVALKEALEAQHQIDLEESRPEFSWNSDTYDYR